MKQRVIKLAAAVLAIPIIIGILVVEIAKLAYQVTAYVTEVLYDGINHRGWYL